ncbi:hypothetical protein LSH36_100g12001 [Paralvinella palmiformis]|uniref:Uncharacterized protein n=1 Tax=Paralvinella palmiformis TaxID=53620 RepID=A0AAD9JZZ0_9ANNE|nr:hypothetical protein LSH36_100g12001 [Paralvinella palmiformis]
MTHPPTMSPRDKGHEPRQPHDYHDPPTDDVAPRIRDTSLDSHTITMIHPPTMSPRDKGHESRQPHDYYDPPTDDVTPRMKDTSLDSHTTNPPTMSRRGFIFSSRGMNKWAKN